MNIISRMSSLWFTALMPLYLAAQSPAPITLDTMTDPVLVKAFQVPATWWLKDNTALLLDTLTPGTSGILQRLDPASGKRSPYYDYRRAQQTISSMRGEETALRPAPDGMTESGRYGYYTIADDIYLVELPTAAVIRVTNTPSKEKSPGFSPDGLRLAFVRANDLYVFDISSRKETRLTFDGNDSLLNGTVSWVYWEEVFGRRDIGYWWSTDSRTLAFLQTDEAGVSIQHYVDITPWTPTVTTQRYPKVGQKNPAVRLGILDVASGKLQWAGLDRNAYEYIVRVDWPPAGDRMMVRTLNRLQTELDFYFVDRTTGAATFIMKDTNEGWINMSDDLYFTRDGRYFITSSERDGYEHLYRFSMDGKLVNQITKGNWRLSSSATAFWVKQAIAGVDEKNGWIYFGSLERSSLEKHLYRINMDGTGMKRLTEEAGTHMISMSPNTKYYFDRFSNVTTLPTLSLYAANGTKVHTLRASDVAVTKQYAMAFPELASAPARDGFALPVSLLKPQQLEAGKKYPVVVLVYGGPSAPSVSNSASASLLWENVLLSNGFLFARIDNRASTGRSKTLENLLLYNTPGDVELNDHVDAVRWIKALPYVDPDRIGIYGWSGGGTHTLLAMTRSKEFKAGIAGAGVTDFRFYDTKWAEAMMKTEKENLAGYERVSLLKYAKDLHGTLMMIHGTHDDNVHPENTWRFVDELVKADKLVELMIYPMKGHGISDKTTVRHRYKTMLDFWKRNL